MPIRHQATFDKKCPSTYQERLRTPGCSLGERPFRGQAVDKEVIDLLKEEQEPATPKQDDVGRGGASVPSPPASAEAMVGVVERVDGAIEGLSSDTR